LLVSRRLFKGKVAEQAERQLQRMLLTLSRGGYVELHPKPPLAAMGLLESTGDLDGGVSAQEMDDDDQPEESPGGATDSSALDLGQRNRTLSTATTNPGINLQSIGSEGLPSAIDYRAEMAYPTDRLPNLLKLKGVHPLYAMFLMNHLGIGDQNEKILAMESLLEMSGSLGNAIDVPRLDEMPAGPLAVTRIDPQLLTLGLATSDELNGPGPDEDPRYWRERFLDGPPRVLTLPHKLQRLFQHDFPGVDDLRVRPCWVAGELLALGGDFNLYITSKKLQKQEGMIFRHLLRLVLLIDELAMLCPADMTAEEWQEEMGNIAFAIESSCRAADPGSAEQWLDEARQTVRTEV
jgi:hypothetical protein